MKITLHQLNVFHKVAQVASVTKAAHALHMTQPAVSNIVRQLEDYYSCPLIEVVGRKLTLTPFGDALITACQEVEEVMSAVQSKMALLKGGVIGTLCVATVSTARYFVPRLLGLFKDKYPEVHLKLTVCNRHEIMTRLQQNLDDFVIMSHPPTTIPVDCADFYDDELIIIAPVTHRYADRDKALPLTKLEQESWIFREEGSGTRYATETIFKNSHFSPTVEMEINDNEAIKQAITAKMGISILSKQSVKSELEHKLVAQIKTKEFPVKHTWYLVKNKAKALQPVAESFFTFVNKHKPVFHEIY